MKRPPEPAGDFTETALSSQLAYDGGLLKLRRDEVSLPGGGSSWREYVEHPGAVMMLAFLDDDGTVVNIEEMKPQTLDSHCSARPVRFALEMNRGWFARRAIKPGAKLTGAPFGSK